VTKPNALVTRVGFDALQDYAASYVPTEAAGKQRLRHRVNLRPDVFERLKETALVEKRTLADIASEAIEAYLQQSQGRR
jgi:sulfite reductase (ferredoxin)